ncbi:hypothetical protein SAMN06272774_1708 [Synechococcus sp. 7002]|nr:hypothetical protein SAMN06272774_1708 [Synechococcus sp. 7002]
MNFSAYQQLKIDLQTLATDLTPLQQESGALVRQGQGFLSFWETQLAPSLGNSFLKKSIALGDRSTRNCIGGCGSSIPI